MEFDRGRADLGVGFLGFGYSNLGNFPLPANRAEPFGFGGYMVTVPHAALVLLLAIVPALWMLRRLRNRSWPERNLCIICGYDLRATPDRRPECGAVAVKAQP